MEIIYQTVQGTVKPIEIDVESSPNGVYLRRNIKEVEQTHESETIKMFQYQEAFLTKSEYEQVGKDLLVKELNGEDNSKEYDEFKKKLKTPVEYKNGKQYKPSWIDFYSEIIDEFANKMNLYEKTGGDISNIVNLKTAIYDVTGKAENAELMTAKEVIDLWLFLYTKKEQYFAEYKAEISKI